MLLRDLFQIIQFASMATACHCVQGARIFALSVCLLPLAHAAVSDIQCLDGIGIGIEQVGGLHAQGVKTRLTYAVGATHVSVLRLPEFFMLARELAEALSR